MLSSQQLKSFIKSTEEKVLHYRYHKISNDTAARVLQQVVLEKGKLSLGLKKNANQYAQEVLGSKDYAPWLYVYSLIAGEFKEGWIPDNFYGSQVIHKIQGDYGKISFLKPLTNHLFQKELGPDLAYYINGQWFGTHFKPLAASEVLRSLFQNTEKIILKLDQSFQGKGIFVFDKKNSSLNQLEEKGNMVVQSFINQHSFFDEFVTSSVATIRLTTVIDTAQKVSLRAAYLRLSRAQDTHVKSSNHIRIPIHVSSGILAAKGYLPNWNTIDKHPDSQVLFIDKQIPKYQECVHLALAQHQKMPMVRAIGWDMIIDQHENPIVLEWNGYSNDIKFSEATQGPCFKDLGWEKLRR
ncbi:MAG: hypothetical protein NWQ38_04475 [Cellulophaga sp.]|nr:hypothetical protein [Cellulophaga sp.]